MMKEIQFVNDFQQFRKACLESIDKDIKICYNNIIVIHNFNYNFKYQQGSKPSIIRQEIAMNQVEGEILDIFQVLTLGGVRTREGEIEYLNLAHNYNIKYMEGDNMMKTGMDNIIVRTVSRGVCTTTYQVECPVCGKKNWSSVKMEMLPKCHTCANKVYEAPQIKMSDIMDMVEVSQNEDKSFTLIGEGIHITLVLDSTQLATLDKIMTNDIKEKLKTLYSISNTSMDANKPIEPPRPVSVPKATPVKSTTTKKSKSKITDEELLFVLEAIKQDFTGKTFKSRDLAPKVSSKLTARQLPSRLTQLVNKGRLEADNSSPKNYSLVK